MGDLLVLFHNRDKVEIQKSYSLVRGKDSVSPLGKWVEDVGTPRKDRTFTE